MHGLGNDFVVVDGHAEPVDPEYYATLAVATCDRHFGIGADGLILVLPSARADFRMRIFNADGSEAEMCGNGIRCFAKYVYDAGLTRAASLTVETARALNPLQLHVRDGDVASVRVDMGAPRFLRRDIPMAGPPDAEAIDEPLEVEGERLAVTGVAIGNPNCVVFVDDVVRCPVDRLGPRLEHHPAFPRRTNVEFIQVLNREELRMRVWERGVGPTLACGSGACASVAAAVRTGRADRRVTVQLDGGPLRIEWAEDERLYMSGPATTVFEGEYPLVGAADRVLIHA